MQETSWPRRKGNLNQQSTQLKDHAEVHIEHSSTLQFCAKAEVVLWVGSRELRGSQYKDSLQTKGFSIVLPLSWYWWTAHLFLWLGMMITVAYTRHHIVQQFCPTWGGLRSMDTHSEEFQDACAATVWYPSLQTILSSPVIGYISEIVLSAYACCCIMIVLLLKLPIHTSTLSKGL
jgi:hypothetical protein